MNFVPLYKTAYSSEFYAHDASNGKGVGFSLLGLLAIVTMLFAYVASAQEFENFYNQSVLPAIDQMPTVSLQKDEIVIDRPWPHIVTVQIGEMRYYIAFQQDAPADIGTIQSWMIENNTPVLVTRTQVFVLKDERELRIFNASDMQEDFTVTPEMMRQGASTFYAWFWPVAIVAGILVLWGLRIIEALLFSLFAMAVGKLARRDLDYPTQLRFSSYAIWPVALLDILARQLGVDLPVYLTVLLVMALIAFAILSVQKTGIRSRYPGEAVRLCLPASHL